MSTLNYSANQFQDGSVNYGDIEIVGAGNELQVPDGSVTLPSITFKDDQDTGFYRSATDTLVTTVGGTQHSQSTFASSTSVLKIGTGASNRGRIQLGAADFGYMSMDSAARMAITCPSNIAIVIDSPGNEVDREFVVANNAGGASYPSSGNYLFSVTESSTQANSQARFYGGLQLAAETVTGAGACSAITTVTIFDLPNTSAGSLAMTLANGAVAGQVKHFITKTADSDDYATLTPTNLAGYSNITFNAAGESASLLFDGAKWHVLSVTGATLA